MIVGQGRIDDSEFKQAQMSDYLALLKNHIDIERVPFSDRGSRLLVFKEKGRNRLYLKLAERLTNLDGDIEAYLHRPPFIQDISLIDEKGESLDFKPTIFPHYIRLETRLGEFGIVFQDRRTLSFGLPEHHVCGLRFHVLPQYWRRIFDGGTFRTVRDLDYHTNGAMVSNQITPEGGGYTVEFLIEGGLDSTIAICIHPHEESGSQALPFSIAKENAKDRWENWFARVPQVSDKYQKTYAHAWWIMANNLISPRGRVTFEAMTPSKIQYVGLWLWDSAMHALAYRYVDPELARNQIRAMLSNQFPNGMIPDAVYDDGVVASIDHPFIGEVTKPPILAWTALKLHEMDPDESFLQEIYVPLVRLHAWWFTMNDDDGDGLAQYNHPYSSGLDNSPLWDEGMPVESPDLNTYLCVQMGSLAMIAEKLGMQAEGAMWRRRAAAIVQRMIRDLWDVDAGLFWAVHDEEPIRIVTPFNLYPIWTGQLPVEIRDKLIAHLKNPDEFWGPFVIPTVARNDPHYDPDTMWRGPVWANVNYFFIEALEQIQEYELANELRSRTLDLIMSHSNIYEYYNAETGDVPSKAAEIFGWTASVFIDLAIKASQAESGSDIPPIQANPGEEQKE
jgi:putative isomerase